MAASHINVSEIEGKTTNVPFNMDLCSSSLKDDKFNSAMFYDRKNPIWISK